jgi:hypothetical protein
VGEDSIEEDQIVYIGNQAVPGDYIDGMLALGWLPYLVIHGDGAASLCERHPEKGPAAAIEEGRRISSWWLATKERRLAVEQAMCSRGLVYYR